jgi:serine/threonine-protein kinase RsbW
MKMARRASVFAWLRLAGRSAFSTGWCRESLVQPDDVPHVLELLKVAMAASGYAEKDVFGMQLALEEAIDNALKHGNRHDPAKRVEVRYQVRPECMVVQIADQGPGFDHARVLDPTSPNHRQRGSGRGVWLIRHYTSLACYNQTGNCLTLWKLPSTVS